MRIGIDVDGVLGNFLDHALYELYVVTGIDIEQSELTEHDIEHLVPEDLKPLYWHKVQLPGAISRLRTLPGAKRGVSILREEGHEIFIVTAAPKQALTWQHERIEWLLRHFDVPDDHIHFTKAKYMVNVDMLIDDKWKNILEWKAEFPDRPAILWGHPFNARHEHELPALTYRLDHSDPTSWEKISKLF